VNEPLELGLLAQATAESFVFLRYRL